MKGWMRMKKETSWIEGFLEDIEFKGNSFLEFELSQKKVLIDRTFLVAMFQTMPIDFELEIRKDLISCNSMFEVVGILFDLVSQFIEGNMETVSELLFPIKAAEQGRALASALSKEAIIYRRDDENENFCCESSTVH